MDSNVGLAIQCVGILLITLLSMFMRSSIKSNALTYWTASWASLSLALISLFAAFRLDSTQTFFYSCYFFGEYLFGLLFIAGCHSQVTGKALTRKHYYFLIPAIVVSLVLPYASRDFNDLFMIHAAILAVLFMISFFTLRKGEAKPGIRLMSGRVAADDDRFSSLRPGVRSAQRAIRDNRARDAIFVTRRCSICCLKYCSASAR